MDEISRRLLFHIGPVGFCVDLNDLVEIREQVAEQVDFSRGDQQSFVAGALPFRRTMIPVVDLTDRLDLASEGLDTALVLGSREGNWALLVNRVVGFYPAAEMKDHPLPQLLQASGWRCFQQLALFDGTPFIRLDLAACYAGNPG